MVIVPSTLILLVTVPVNVDKSYVHAAFKPLIVMLVKLLPAVVSACTATLLSAVVLSSCASRLPALTPPNVTLGCGIPATVTLFPADAVWMLSVRSGSLPLKTVSSAVTSAENADVPSVALVFVTVKLSFRLVPVTV